MYQSPEEQLTGAQMLDRVLKNLALIESVKFNRLDLVTLDPKQAEFAYASADPEIKEFCFFGANGTGKTLTGAVVVARHATGRYGDDWKGYRFDCPIRVLACGETVERTRDIVQSYLLGDYPNWGTGLIPKECIESVVSARGSLEGAVDTAHIKNFWPDGRFRGLSSIKFMAYEKGRKKFQGGRYHLVWPDEDPGMDIYGELIGRLASVKPRAFIHATFTPLEGLTGVALRFIQPEEGDTRKFSVTMGLREVSWLTKEEAERQIMSYAPWERGPRGDGIPILGSGMVWPVPLEKYVIPARPMPRHFGCAGGIDFGGTVAGIVAYLDPESDTCYIASCYEDKTVEGHGIAYHCANLQNIGIPHGGKEMTWFWPHDGHVHDRTSGQSYAKEFKGHGLNMFHTHSTFPDGGFSQYVAAHQILDGIVSGKVYILDVPQTRILRDSIRTFHYDKDGKIPHNQRRHTIDAFMKWWMMRRYILRQSRGRGSERKVQTTRDMTPDEIYGLGRKYDS